MYKIILSPVLPNWPVWGVFTVELFVIIFWVHVTVPLEYILPLHVVFPDIFNVDKCVDAPCNILVPDTFNELLIVVILFNVVFPDTFNVDKNVDGLFKLTCAGGFKIAL